MDQEEKPRPPAFRASMIRPLMPPAPLLRPLHLWCRAGPLVRDVGWRQEEHMEEPHPPALQASRGWHPLPLAAQL